MERFEMKQKKIIQNGIQRSCNCLLHKNKFFFINFLMKHTTKHKILNIKQKNETY
jgi:hypothetical protein